MRVENGVKITEPAAFKELARLCLLLGGASNSEDAFELSRARMSTGNRSRCV